MKRQGLVCAVLLVLGLGCEDGRPASQAPAGGAGDAQAQRLSTRDDRGLEALAPDYRVHVRDTSLPFAPNPAQRFVSSFARDRLRVHSSRVDAPYDVHVALQAFGFDDALQPVTASERSVEPERVRYARRNADGVTLTEWFDNRPEGVEQGFIIDAPPVEATETLRLALRFDGDLHAEVVDDQQVWLVDADDAHQLTYDALHAYDADGVSLPARFVPGADGTVDIVVDVAGARFPVTIDPTLWTYAAGFIGSGINGGDEFGTAIAVDGDTAVVGAPGYNGGRGAAYVLTRSGGVWTEQQRLLASDADEDDWFGTSVAIDGDRIVVGAPGVDGPFGILGRGDAGQAYLFERDAGTWNETEILDPDPVSDPVDWRFGAAVGISGDVIAVGAPEQDCENFVNMYCGRVYIFARNGDAWPLDEEEFRNRTANDDYFGESLALSGDTLVVGMPGRGSAFVYKESGGSWTGGSDLRPAGVSANDEFGAAVSLSGNRLLIGSPASDSNAGEAFLFTRANAGGNFTLDDTVIASDRAGGDRFGAAVSLAGDMLLVGAPEDAEGADGIGATYSFEPDAGDWTQQGKQIANAAQDDARFGAAVAIAGDQLLVGLPGHDGAGNRSGRVEVFDASDAGAELGEACGAQSECKSGFCVDGVCCESACGGGDPGDCQVCGAGGSCGPAVADTECRPADGACDVAEVCNGTATTCPADGFDNTGSECRAAVSVCDVAEHCDGSGPDCPSDEVGPADTVCLAAAGPCDVDDVCDGVSPECPVLVAEAGTVCGAKNPDRPCDVEDVCDGENPQCPAVVAEAGTVCRPAATDMGCDAEEVCDGERDTCPSDKVKPLGALCRPAESACDMPEVCDGGSATCPVVDPTPAPAGTVCRSGDGSACDPDEVCDGSGLDCPDDARAPLGSACEDDGDPCTADMCTADGCAHVDEPDCGDADAGVGTGGMDGTGTGGSDNGATGGVTGSGGVIAGSGGVIAGSGGIAGTGGASGTGGSFGAGTGGSGAPGSGGGEDDGCGCRAVGAPRGQHSTGALPMLALGLIGLVGLRRRRR